MDDNLFIEIEAPHLCVLENESEELINEGTYGKALSLYLQSKLSGLGYAVPWVVCEDWGWYVPAAIDGFRMGICVYGLPRSDDELAVKIYEEQDVRPGGAVAEPAGVPLSLCVQVDTRSGKYWDWRRFRRMDRSELVAQLNRDLLAVFDADPEVDVVKCCHEFPLG